MQNRPYFALPNIILPDNVLEVSEKKEEKEEEKTETKEVITAYKNTPCSFPFDIYEAYHARIISFINGALYVLEHDPSIDAEVKASRIAAITQLKEKKEQQLERFKQNTYGHKVTFESELYRFYHDELPNASGLKSYRIALGEMFYVWQEIDRPIRRTVYERSLGDKGKLIIEQIETPRASPLIEAQKKEFLRIHLADKKQQPDWYKKLDIFAKKRLREIVPYELEGNWDAVQRCRPTMLRHIPGEANATKHELRVTHVSADGEHKLVSSTSAYRQGAPTSFKMRNNSERQHSANQNLAQMLDDVNAEAKNQFRKTWGDGWDEKHFRLRMPMMLNSLFTPARQAGTFAVTRFLDFLGLSGDDDNTKLTSENEIAVQNYWRNRKDRYVKMFNLNVAVNKYRKGKIAPNEAFIHFSSLFCFALMEKCRKKDNQPDIQNEMEDRIPKLKAAISQIKLFKTASPIKDQNPNLYLAALYDVTTRQMQGVSTGNCKSSKDRKSLEFMMADAMLIYYSEQQLLNPGHPEFPRYGDTSEKRQRFVEIFCELYASGHHLLSSHDNAPGCPGIKDQGILDRDIVAKLESMRNEKRMAPTANQKDKTEVKSEVREHKTPAKLDIPNVYSQSKQIAGFSKPGNKLKRHKKTVKHACVLLLVTVIPPIIACCLYWWDERKDKNNTFAKQEKRIPKVNVLKSPSKTKEGGSKGNTLFVDTSLGGRSSDQIAIIPAPITPTVASPHSLSHKKERTGEHKPATEKSLKTNSRNTP